MGGVQDPKSHLVVAGKHRIEFRAVGQEPVECALAVADGPVAFEYEAFLSLAPGGLDRLSPAIQALLRLAPGQRTRHDPDPARPSGQEMLRGEAADGDVVDGHGRQTGFAGHAADQHQGHGQLAARRVGPGPVVPNLRDRPDDSVDLARAESIEEVVYRVGFGLEDEIERDPEPQFCGLAFHRNDDVGGPEVLEPVRNHAKQVASTDDQAARQQVGGVAEFADDLLDSFDGVRGDVGLAVDYPGHGLNRYAGGRRYVADRRPLTLRHARTSPVYLRTMLPIGDPCAGHNWPLDCNKTAM